MLSPQVMKLMMSDWKVDLVEDNIRYAYDGALMTINHHTHPSATANSTSRLKGQKTVRSSTRTVEVPSMWHPPGPYQDGVWRIHVELPVCQQHGLHKALNATHRRPTHTNHRPLGLSTKSTTPTSTKCPARCASTSLTRRGAPCLVRLQHTHTHGCTRGCTHPPPSDLLNVFETFLPQLLLYPNPTDPLNGEAAALLMREPESYSKKVRGALCIG